MTTVQKGLALAAFAKQTTKGTVTAAPAYSHGLLSGAVFGIDISEEPEMVVVDASLLPTQANRTAAMPAYGFKTRAYAASVGYWFYSALGGVVTTGTTPKLHTITPASTLPYNTCYGKFGGVWNRMQDAKVDSLTISWEENQPAELEISLIGTVPTIGVTAPAAATNDDSYQAYMTPAGGTFKFDTNSGVAITAPVKAGSVKISNNLEAVFLSGVITPDDISEGDKLIECSLTLVVPDMDIWRETVTGTNVATVVSGAPIFGSFEVLLTVGTPGSTDIQLACTRIAWTCKFPEVDPSSGPVEIQVDGMCYLTTAGANTFSVLVHNAITAY